MGSHLFFWGHPIFLYIKPHHFLPSQPLSPSPASSADLPSSGSAHPKPPASWPCLTCWGLRCQAVKPWKTSHQKAWFFQSDSGDSEQFRPFWTFLESSGSVQKSTREVRALWCFFKRCRQRLCAVFVVWFLKKKIRDVIVSSYFFGLTDTMRDSDPALKKNISCEGMISDVSGIQQSHDSARLGIHQGFSSWSWYK